MINNSIISEYFFGKNLRNLRKAKKLTLVNLSILINISKSALSDYETGKSTPSLDIIQKVASFFNVSIDLILNSEISEKEIQVVANKQGNSAQQAATAKEEIGLANEKYIFSLKLLNQKLESTNVQMQLLRQLLQSKDAENKTLKINITLLEEQLRNFTKK